ncbi:MAG: hypothetical protein A3H57_03385 [Candidatus Taylorbacteria bacterium RIFCSPLOWO2_02_FULL_43_11]|uniref:DUF378 domain-containing protein n=1 Tax=Candidatus Taylorbacteria bacterium RIFCSPHIGHO2_02_FULL_43_32b TaxID=1802306 RepID=A0A1G2MGY2_9BACT|nr:MAG: hypothetical protein A2743_02500 [Candidatus Taylorbacteria bacterium RIFCSPHIGHO2_01_FULL_43_47]OHA22262.1 MAG: hypothetical protein A3C72_04175 [Candidatus Taylorbacteria bacterium RIFCSPHIGHO2_02_FULL_43_32b]OHA29603.1 MAG: hypothetical protein A3B08_03220 [Candidatus Taylorbacteria bacterium RIFCSPLOWO2_01_FULL_43_44]OHA36146.1 MAG: hypothetical protein A3H57_03385 [Candidatus Taylorbacteria bacterium RIFCSPLOWO2_02_FULL_43_11]
MKAIHMVAFVLLVVGGLNWLLAAFGWDLATWVDVAWWGTLLKVVYVLVGLSAILEVVNHKKNCKHCAGGSTSSVM